MALSAYNIETVQTLVNNRRYSIGFADGKQGTAAAAVDCHYAAGYAAGRSSMLNSANAENSANLKIQEKLKFRNSGIQHFRLGQGKIRGLDWELIQGCREMRNCASDTAKMCHPIKRPITGDKPLRGDRPVKFGHYCGAKTYGMPVHG